MSLDDEKFAKLPSRVAGVVPVGKGDGCWDGGALLRVGVSI